MLRSSSCNIMFCSVFHSSNILAHSPQYFSLNCGFSYSLSLFLRYIITRLRCWLVHSQEGSVSFFKGDHESAWEVDSKELTQTPTAMHAKQHDQDCMKPLTVLQQWSPLASHSTPWGPTAVKVSDVVSVPLTSYYIVLSKVVGLFPCYVLNLLAYPFSLACQPVY